MAGGIALANRAITRAYILLDSLKLKLKKVSNVFSSKNEFSIAKRLNRLVLKKLVE